MDWNQSTNPGAGPQAHDFWAFPGSLPERPGGGTDHVNLDAPFPFRFGPGADGVAPGPQGPHDPRGRRDSCCGDECSSDEESQTPAASPGPDAKTPPAPEAEPSGEKEGFLDPAEHEKAADKPGEKPAGGAHGCRHGRRHHRHGPRGPHGPHGPHGHEHFGPPGGPFGGPFFGGPFGGGPFGGPFHGPPPFAGRGRGGRWFGRRGGGGFGFGPHQMHEAKQAFAAAAMAAHQHVGRYMQSLSQNLNGASPDAAANVDGGDDDDGSNDLEYFTPPVDIFETANSSWVVHVAVPGAKKEDMGIHWQAERGVLAISGVVYRPGDEALQRGLVSSERKTGLFKREVRLPPPSSSPSSSSAPTGKAEVDAKAISARLEDGVLSITVPRVEKEWTDVLKVDIL